MLTVSHPKAKGRLVGATERALEEGRAITSLSGARMAAAMDWCHRNGRAYDVQYTPGAGWCLELRPDCDPDYKAGETMPS